MLYYLKFCSDITQLLSQTWWWQFLLLSKSTERHLFLPTICVWFWFASKDMVQWCELFWVTSWINQMLEAGHWHAKKKTHLISYEQLDINIWGQNLVSLYSPGMARMPLYDYCGTRLHLALPFHLLMTSVHLIFVYSRRLAYLFPSISSCLFKGYLWSLCYPGHPTL